MMASQDVTANSRLADMQMKFQKKQKLEREQKKLALTGDEISQASKKTTGNGKVRQMFDDRRRGVGIDRSHPLRPIMASTTSTIGASRTTTQPGAPSKALVGGTNIARRPAFTNATSTQSKTISRSSLNNNYSITNGNLNVFRSNFDEVDNIDNETFPTEFSSLSLNSTHVMGPYVTNDPDFENNSNEESSILGGTVVIDKNTTKAYAIKLNPVITKKLIATTTTAGKTTSRTSSNSSRVSSLSKATTSSIKSPPPKAATSPTTKNIKTVGNKTLSHAKQPATFILSVKPPPRISTPPPGMSSCQYCQRHFNEERLVKHEEVCRKMMSKKRKIFDASKHRVKGTEAETYLKKGFNSTASKTVTVAINTAKGAKISGEKKSNWRKKHEDFIAAIREAKKVQAHLAKGGKLSDLPPPPPSENPDYIQCPHCSRRFNESAAARHIPKCANMQHNKPKPTKKRL